MAINPVLAKMSFIPLENSLGNSLFLSFMCIAELGQSYTGSKLCFKAQEVVTVAFVQ